MIKDLGIQANYSAITLLKSDFHIINQLITSKDKTFEVKICSKSFFFSKEQILLFSVEAYIQIMRTKMSFCLTSSPNFPDERVISCFHEIFLLFSTSNEIQINLKNAFLFQYLANVFNNSTLLTICETVIQTTQSQIFFLTSDSFSLLTNDILDSINNFNAILPAGAIKCNSIFASLISHRIFRQVSQSSKTDFIDFSDYQFPEIIKSFFNILK
jgi:hypothetical protein